jgi:carboxyl-terminal processing protease
MKERNTIVIGLIGCFVFILTAACLSGALLTAYTIGQNSATVVAPGLSDPPESVIVAPTLSEPSDPFLTPLAPPTSNNEDGAEVSSGDGVVQENPAAVAPQPTAVPFDVNQLNIDLLEEVLIIAAQQYDGDIPPADMVLYAAIEGALSTLDDDYTRFYPPAVAVRMREGLTGSFQGIGAFVRLSEDGRVQIARPMAGFPAARAGVLAGDIILAVDGVSLEGLTLDEAVTLVRGPRDTAVTLTIEREGVDDPFDITIIRAVIEIPLVEAQMLDDDVAYIRLSSFSRNARSQLETELAALLAQNPQALIFDLRDNPGGFLDQSVYVADLFLPEGVVLLERNRRGLDETFYSYDGDIGETIPLIVLINAGSASASEIVAGAIQDNGRGVIIGETSFGKGSVQQPFNLSDGSELRVTIARWYTPNDQTIDGRGIIPDVESGPSPLDFLGPDDVQLQRAIEYILEGR